MPALDYGQPAHIHAEAHGLYSYIARLFPVAPGNSLEDEHVREIVRLNDWLRLVTGLPSRLTGNRTLVADDFIAIHGAKGAQSPPPDISDEVLKATSIIRRLAKACPSGDQLTDDLAGRICEYWFSESHLRRLGRAVIVLARALSAGIAVESPRQPASDEPPKRQVKARNARMGDPETSSLCRSDDPLLNQTQAAELLGVVPETIRNWVRDGKFLEPDSPPRTRKRWKRSKLVILKESIETQAGKLPVRLSKPA